MKVATESAPNSRVILNIEVDQETVDHGIRRAYQRLSNRLRIPGFRPGKAPLAVVERHVGRAVLMQEAIDLLLPDLFRRAVEETGIKPIAQPHFDLVQMEPLTLKATVDVEPTVELGNYRALRIERPPVEVSDADIDAAIEELRQQHAEHVPVERPVQTGDLVTLDVRATVGERTLTDRQNIEYLVDPQNQSPIPGFATQIVGMRAGEERTFDLTLPEDLEDKELTGQLVQCTVKIHDVKEVQLPPLDDSLARLHGETETLAELRARLKTQLLEQRTREAAERYEEAVIARVVEEARVEVPESMVEDDINHMLERALLRVNNQPLARQQFLHMLEHTGDQLRAQLRPEAERTIKTELVLDAVAAAEGIDVQADEIAAEIERMVESVDEQGEQLRQLASRPRAQESIGQSIRRRRARELLVRLASGQPAVVEDKTAPATPEPRGENHE